MPTPREITKEFIQKHLSYPDLTAYKLADELLQELYKAIREGRPKRLDTFGCAGDPIGAERIGYNDAIDDYDAAIKKLLEVI